MRILFNSYFFTLVSCLIVLIADLEQDPDVGNLLNATEDTSRRMLKGGGGVIASLSGPTLGSLGMHKTLIYAGDAADVQGVLWLTLFGAIFFMMPCVMPSPRCPLPPFPPHTRAEQTLRVGWGSLLHYTLSSSKDEPRPSSWQICRVQAVHALREA